MRHFLFWVDVASRMCIHYYYVKTEHDLQTT